MAPNTKNVTEYTGEIMIEKQGQACIVQLQGSSPAIVQQLITLLFDKKGRLEDNKVYSETHFDGQQPIGWYSPVEVPFELSVKAATEHRLQLLGKAA